MCGIVNNCRRASPLHKSYWSGGCRDDAPLAGRAGREPGLSADVLLRGGTLYDGSGREAAIADWDPGGEDRAVGKLTRSPRPSDRLPGIDRRAGVIDLHTIAIRSDRPRSAKNLNY